MVQKQKKKTLNNKVKQMKKQTIHINVKFTNEILNIICRKDTPQDKEDGLSDGNYVGHHSQMTTV